MNIDTLIQIGQIIPKNIISDAIRWFLIGLDSIIYGFIGIIFSLIFSMTNLNNLSFISDISDEIVGKVYLIIGIFMLFKLTVSLLTYLANPDQINDRELGAGKLVTRLVTSLILLIVIPTIVFPFLHDIQIPLANTVGRIITGQIASINQNKAFEDGQNAALTLMGTFFYADSSCTSEETVSMHELGGISGIVDLVNLPCETESGTDKTRYMYNYLYGASSVVAIVSVVLLLIIGINVAIRAFKLLVLEVLAPIPILSYINPKSSKDGMFASYTKLYVSTYLDLFIQFGIFYLVLRLIAKISSINLLDVSVAGAEMLNNGLAFSFPFLFIGLLIFAIMAPKFIKKALNLKEGEFGTGVAGMLATGATLAGATGSAVSGFNTSAAQGHGMLRNIGAGLAGAIGGVTTGAKVGFGSGKADYSKVLGSINDYNTRSRTNANSGTSLTGRVGTNLMRTFTGQTPYDIDEANIAKLDAQSSNGKKLREYLIGEGKKKVANIQQSVKVNGVTQNVSLDQINEAINYANSANGDGYVHFADGSSYAVGSSVINRLLGDLEEGAGKIYAEAVDQGRLSDPGALSAFRKTFADSMGIDPSALGKLGTDISEIKKIEKSAATESYRIKNSKEYHEHKVSANAVKK